MQVSSLTVEELTTLIRKTVTETIQALMLDPDAGDSVRPEVEQRLLSSLGRTQAGERGLPLSEVIKRLGLDRE